LRLGKTQKRLEALHTYRRDSSKGRSVMAHPDTLRRILQRIDRKGYKAYRDIKGTYEFPGFRLTVDHVQGDPFAAPSRVRANLSHDQAGFDPWLYGSRSREIAFRDFLTRAFHHAVRRFAKGNRGIGKSGLIAIDVPGQEILERSSVLLLADGIEARFVVGLPAAGRTVLGNEAAQMFFDEIPGIVHASLTARSLDTEVLREHVACAEDQDAMRNQLANRALVAFLANGSILPRLSGVDDRPLDDPQVVPLQAPAALEVTLDRPNHGPIQGLGIPRGVTLIVGGGFHGKSTLLNAVQRSVYNHIPGDGRENAVTCTGAVKITAEDGRYVEQVNISPFIQNLPFGKDTRRFSTENTSGSTSQAANILEAVEIGVELLLIDEDTSATNFMIRDERMQALVAKEKEPITPFVDKVRQLYDEFNISTLLVMGGSGDYFDVADRVTMMDHYHPVEVTDQVYRIRSEYISRRRIEGGERFGEITPRVPLRESFQAQRGRKEVKIDAKGLRHILYGRTLIDLTHVEQLVDESQTRTIGAIIHYYAVRYATGHLDLRAGLMQVFRDLRAGKGFDLLTPGRVGDLAMPRIQEVAAAINRMRSLKVR
jgi:predicted ABC-class ATPase